MHILFLYFQNYYVPFQTISIYFNRFSQPAVLTKYATRYTLKVYSTPKWSNTHHIPTWRNLWHGTVSPYTDQPLVGYDLWLINGFIAIKFLSAVRKKLAVVPSSRTGYCCKCLHEEGMREVDKRWSKKHLFLNKPIHYPTQLDWTGQRKGREDI